MSAAGKPTEPDEVGPSTPMERLTWSAADLAEAWRRYAADLGITADQIGRLVAAYRSQLSQGPALLARHRQRRHHR